MPKFAPALDSDDFGFKMPMQDYVCSITPTEFEKYCKEVLLGYAEDENLCRGWFPGAS